MKPTIKINEKYGFLTVIKQVEKPTGIKSEGRFWECLCDCGNKTIKPTRYFNMPYKYGISCGCKNVNPVNNLTGLTFYHLKVIKRDASRNTGKDAYWICQCDCGKEISVRSGELTSKTQKSCGCYRKKWASGRTGKNSPSWKGGRTMKQGYVCVRMPDHPNAAKNGYVKEHILVMSKHIGRSLLKNEMVHHKDGNRTNNDISNLELCRHGQPPGQRVDDLVKWAWDIIDTYDPSLHRNVNYSNKKDHTSS